MTTIQLIKKQISNSKFKNGFTISDFKQIAKYETLKRTIARLERQKFIKRVIRGVYYKPEYSKTINMWSAANIDDVVAAIARSKNLKVCISGERVLNYMHLSTQVPNTYVYAWTGQTTKLKINNINIILRKNTNKDFTFDNLTNIVIQSLKMIGKNNVDDRNIKIYRCYLDEKQKKQILKNMPISSEWIRKTIKMICR